MKRIHLGLALLFVVVLITAASWTRLAQAKKPVANLIAVPSAASSESDMEAATALADLTAGLSTSTGATENLTDTDLVSRQLLSSYIDLAGNGQATEEQIGMLADQYASQISSLSAAPTATLKDIKPVTNTTANFRTYADTFTQIEKDYAAEIAKTNPDRLDLSQLGPDFYSFTATFGLAYEHAAEKLKTLPVPAALVENHLKLVNLYLSSAQALESLSQTDKDSVLGFSGLLNFSNNLKDEQATVANISQILTDNGQ